MNSLNNSPTLEYEQNLWKQGLVVAGVDEAGRGPLAGPVTAGAVVFSKTFSISHDWCTQVRDSKTLSESQREKAAINIQKYAEAYATASCQSGEIDAIGIAEATRSAMRQAVAQLNIPVQYLLIDYLTLPDIPSKGIVHGDAICFSIASASILAKVTRDQYMKQMDVEYPGYFFAQHKGYGTKKHLSRLKELGPSPIHRYSFNPIKQYALF